MNRRFLFALPALVLAGCTQAPSVPSTTSVPLASLPRHRHLAQLQELASAELLRPAPDVSELKASDSAQFGPPPPGSAPANYLAFLNDSRPKKGLIICEPRGDQTGFGAGCARWMTAMGAGSPSFEVVPTWGASDDFQQSHDWDLHALEQERAVQLARGLDASHVAFGSFDGHTLKFQLLDVRHVPSATLGSFQIAGSQAQIAAQLPSLTRQLVAATGVSGVQVPSRVALNVSDLSFLGTIPRNSNELQTLPAPQLARLKRLADDPLAALFIARTPNPLAAVQLRAARALLAVAPHNALAAGEVGMYYWGLEKLRRTQILHALDTKFPRNLAIALGSAALRAEEEDYFAQVHFAEMAARTSPHCAVAWDLLGDGINKEADEKRQGKYWTEMSRDQQSVVEQLYPRAVAATWKATQLSPKTPAYWTNLSNASTFASSPSWARAALAKALELDPHNSDALNWGLEIFQPKWFGDNATFLTMARLAVSRANAKQEDIDVSSLEDGLQRTGQEALKCPLLRKLLEHQPDNMDALLTFSYANRMEMGESKTSLPFARHAVQLAPNNTQALTELADIEQHDMGQYAQSIALFRRAIKIEPRNPLHWVNMALSYAKWGKMDEARADAIKGRALGYHGPHPVWHMVGLSPDGNDAPQTHATPRIVS